ncbi:unnamed protein product [Citrullus colocynthis]|uniref:Uncharacterized protein n=1 Tax=Citrullus colocynthis TaxID=252529 RepID=A0ABP0Y075_9ROSI
MFIPCKDIDSEVQLHLGFQVSRKDPTTEVLPIIASLARVRSEISRTGKGSGETKHASKSREIAISFAEKLFTEHKYFIDLLKSKSTIARSELFSLKEGKKYSSCF